MPDPIPNLAWPPPPHWRQQLATHGVLCVHGLPCDADNTSLRALGAALGEPSMRALSPHPSLIEPGGVQRVTALAVTPSDQYGKPLLSASAEPFELHTDESFIGEPARYVLLHCWQPDATGGQSLLCDARTLWQHADRLLQIALTQIRLGYPCGDYPLVDPSGQARYNRQECRVPPSVARWADRFDEVLKVHAQPIALGRRDLLIIDNRRWLHGRRGFSAPSGRLLKRLRIR